MVSKIFHQLFFPRMIICLVMLSFLAAHAMDQAIIPQVDDIVWKLCFTHKRDALPYDDEHAFAQTSRSNCALIYTIQDQRKKCIHNYIVKNNIAFSNKAQFVYHRSWRKLGAIDIVPEEKSDSNILTMRLLEINDNGLIVPKIATWHHFKAPLPYNPSPFFNKNKEFCFHGVEKSTLVDPAYYHKVVWQGVVEYGISERIPCELLCPSSGLEPLHMPLIEFLKFPVLIKNILDSDGATLRDFNNYSFSHYKSYYIGNVLLSENYKYFQELPYGNDPVKSFGGLPQSARTALKRQYEKQPKAK